MNIREKIFQGLIVALLLVGGSISSAQAQMDLHLDTIESHIVGFSFGMKMPSTLLSKTEENGEPIANMASLYKPPYLDYGISGMYKYKNNWLVSIDGNLWMGEDNLKNREARMSNLFTHDSNSIIISGMGADGEVSCYNRGFSVQGGIGKIFPLAPEKNPNSGIMAKVTGGFMLQQTIFMVNSEESPQVQDDYALLYDHQRRGFLLSEGLGYWFMSNRLNLVNFYVEFNIQQCWSRSTRDYVIDDYLGMHNKDNTHYFDLLYTLKICWMFPLRGKQAHDIYFY